MRSCSLPVLTEEAAEQVASVYNALVILAQDSQRGRQSGGCSPAPTSHPHRALGWTVQPLTAMVAANRTATMIRTVASQFS